MSGTWPFTVAPSFLAILFTFLAIGFALQRKRDFEIITVDDKSDCALPRLGSHFHQECSQFVSLVFNEL